MFQPHSLLCPGALCYTWLCQDRCPQPLACPSPPWHAPPPHPLPGQLHIPGAAPSTVLQSGWDLLPSL